MAFTVGQKVVCVDATDNKYIKLDHIYTVRCIAGFRSGKPGLRIEERRQELDAPFYIHRFRPIVERKTEISFTTGADPESEKWDNRKPFPVYSFDVTEHESILQYLRGFY